MLSTGSSAERHEAGRGQQAEAEREDEDQHDPEPEVRHGDSREAHAQGRLVLDPAAAQCRQHPERYRRCNREHEREPGELDRDREPIDQQVADRLVAPEVESEVAAQDVAEPVQVLDVDRVVETEVLPHCGHELGRRVQPEYGEHGVARDEPDDQEDEHRHAEQHRHGQRQPS